MQLKENSGLNCQKKSSFGAAENTTEVPFYDADRYDWKEVEIYSVLTGRKLYCRYQMSVLPFFFY